MTPKLTDLEITALAELWQSSKGNGHDFGFPDDLPSIPRKQRGGVVSSLVKKGLIYVYDNSGDQMPNQFEFSDDGKRLFGDFRNSPALNV